MGFFKNLRRLHRQAKQLEKQVAGRGVDTGLRGLLRRAPAMMSRAGDALSLVQEGISDRERLLRVGVPATARLVAVRDTGMTIGGSALGLGRDNPVADLRLEVRLAGGDPYETTTRQMVPRLAVGRLVPGTDLPVRVDPADHNKVMIDWEAPV